MAAIRPIFALLFTLDLSYQSYREFRSQDFAGDGAQMFVLGYPPVLVISL